MNGAHLRAAARWGAVATLAGGLSACPGFGDRVLSGRVTWESDVERILQAECTSCHGTTPSNGAPFPLVTYAQAKPFAERIQVRSYQLRNMPPNDTMPESDREKLFIWWQTGAPESDDDLEPLGGTPVPLGGIPEPMGGTPEPGGMPEPTGGMPEPTGGEPVPEGPTWSNGVGELIGQRCAVCHGATLVGGAPYALATYAQVVEHADRVRARAIELDTMPPGAALDADAQDLLQRWFDGGTPE